MSLTRAQFRTQVMKLADAQNSNRWDTAPGGEVDLHISAVLDQEWRRILNANRHYQLAARTPTSTSGGYYLWTDLSSGSGDALQRPYRVLNVVIDSVVYEEAKFEQHVLASTPASTTFSYPQYLWRFEGRNIFALPLQANHVATGIWVNWIPQQFNVLVTDFSVVPFPEGYEFVPIFESAARLLLKGGAEAVAAAQLQAQDEQLRADMLQDLARLSTKPLRMTYSDSALEWGG